VSELDIKYPEKEAEPENVEQVENKETEVNEDDIHCNCVPRRK